MKPRINYFQLIYLLHHHYPLYFISNPSFPLAGINATSHWDHYSMWIVTTTRLPQKTASAAAKIRYYFCQMCWNEMNYISKWVSGPMKTRKNRWQFKNLHPNHFLFFSLFLGRVIVSFFMQRILFCFIYYDLISLKFLTFQLELEVNLFQLNLTPLCSRHH